MSQTPSELDRARDAAVGDVPIGNTYDKYGSGNPIERRMLDGFFRTFDAMVAAARPTRVVEVGIGEGHVADRLSSTWPSAKVVGIDLPDPELAASWDRLGVTAAQASALALPFRSDSADLVLAIEVLEHVDDPDGALREIARVASSDVVVSVPLEPVWRVGNLLRGRYVRDLGNTPGHIQHWSKRSFVELVSRHLEVVEVRTPLPWTMVRARRRS
jgi:SAM-dependent methyltransferase